MAKKKARGRGRPPSGRTEQLPLRLSPELRRRLEARAARDGGSLTDTVIRALEAYLVRPNSAESASERVDLLLDASQPRLDRSPLAR